MSRIFVYIPHKDGMVDDTCAELLTAARKIDPSQMPTAVVTEFGSQLDEVCENLPSFYDQI